jgi:hypothetical protein
MTCRTWQLRQDSRDKSDLTSRPTGQPRQDREDRTWQCLEKYFSRKYSRNRNINNNMIENVRKPNVFCEKKNCEKLHFRETKFPELLLIFAFRKNFLQKFCFYSNSYLNHWRKVQIYNKYVRVSSKNKIHCKVSVQNTHYQASYCHEKKWKTKKQQHIFVRMFSAEKV